MKMRAEVTMWSSSGSTFDREPSYHKSSLDIRTITSKAPVSRAITFGSPISNKKMTNHQLMRDQMDQVRICEKSKWGFDFFNETPLSSSKYDWKKKSDDSLSSYSYIGCKKCDYKNNNSSPYSSKNSSYENLSSKTTTNSSTVGGCK